ncbi:MAG: sulfite exporter TauE/SafE family protein [Terracidiphilus sp.]|jgi:sulfite exporter TauE/SafE
MGASATFSEALVLGLASGPACIAACGPILVPSLLTERAGLRPHARYLSVFLAARLMGYLLFAAVAWEIGALISLAPGPRVVMMGAVNLSIASVLLWYAWSAKSLCGQSCAGEHLVEIGEKENHRAAGPGALGLLTGLNLCPPFVAAGVRAAQSGSVTGALLFFFFFFLGTSVWFIPFISFGCMARNQAVITVARMAMALIALYYASLGIAMLIGRKAYGY